MKKNKVVDIAARLERWNTAYELDGLCISVSTHGRINIRLDDKDVSLPLVDGVDMLGRVSEAVEQLSGL
jgi:hypothetical protein